MRKPDNLIDGNVAIRLGSYTEQKAMKELFQTFSAVKQALKPGETRIQRFFMTKTVCLTFHCQSIHSDLNFRPSLLGLAAPPGVPVPIGACLVT